MTPGDLLTAQIPPHSVETERAVLGGVLLDGAEAWSRAGERLEAEDFFLERHRRLWGIYRDLVADGLGIDLATVREALRPHLDDLGGVEPAVWLAELIEEAATLTNLVSYAAIVARYSARRLAIREATHLIKRAYDDGADPSAFVPAAAAALNQIAVRAQVHAPKPPAEAHLLRDSVDEAMAALESGTSPGLLSLPYPGLNRLLAGGLAPGELMYLGARPGVGKTSLALDVARHVARQGRSVLVVSREMVRRALARRLMAQEAQVSALALRRGRLEPGELVLLRSALPGLRALPIWLTDEAERLEEIIGLARGFEKTPPLGLVIVDYLQLVRAPREIRERRHQVEAVSQALKALAVDASVPVICLSSLARATDGDRSRRPTMADLRESGELEHDADVILLLHRPPMERATEGIVAKNRDGSVGLVSMLFHPETVRFTEVSERAESF